MGTTLCQTELCQLSPLLHTFAAIITQILSCGNNGNDFTEFAHCHSVYISNLAVFLVTIHHSPDLANCLRSFNQKFSVKVNVNKGCFILYFEYISLPLASHV